MEPAPRTVNEAVGRARTVGERVAAPAAAFTDEGHWPAETLAALQEAGLGGLVAPLSVGGAGLGLRALAGVCEELAKSCASSAICFGMHAVGTAVIAARATESQTKSLLGPIAAGEHLTTLALSEPGTGGQFWIPQVTLRRTDDGFMVAGEKSFVTNGSRVDSYVVSTVAADADAPTGQFSCVVVPGDARGIEWLGSWNGIGMRGNSSRSVRLHDVPVPIDNLLGAEGDQIWYVFEVVAPFFLMAMSGTYLGVAQSSLEAARAHLSARRHSHTGRTLSSEPVVQHRIGELWANVERTRRFVYWAAEEADQGGPDALLAVTAAKAEVAECAVHVTNEAMTLVGGIGYRDRSVLERNLRDARAAHVMAPTTDLLRTWTGRALLDIPLLGD